MKKIVSLMFTAMLAAQCLVAQVPEGIKYLNYNRNKSAKEAFQKAYDANPKDPQAIYWLGQALLATDGDTPTKTQIAAAKALYQKGLQEIGSDPLILVGMGQVEILEGGDINSAKQKFEQAITATTETKGRNKGKPSIAILTAIGRANAEVPSTMGDHMYAIDKLKQAAAIDPLTTPSDVYVNMGINYLKMGGENGGEAVKAYQEAISRDPKNALAMYRIGKIYQSQNNKDLFELNFNNGIVADPNFPQVYLALFEYYANRDVNKAKEYLDKYIATADKTPENDVFVAEYLFRATKYNESIAKLKELDASIGAANLPSLYLLYAYNYDRIADSVQAKANLEKYFANPSAKIKPDDYDLAVKVFSKFPGSEGTAAGYLEKAILNDTSRVNKLDFMAQAADLYFKAKNYPEQFKWLQKRVELKGSISEADYYALTTAALNAKDYPQSITLAKKYLLAYPDKPQPYTFLRRAAFGADPDSTNGLLIENLSYLDSMYTVQGKDKYKAEIFRNQYPIIMTYLKKLDILKKNPDLKVKPDGTKPESVQQFLAITQKLVELADMVISEFPDPTDQNNKFAQDVKNGMLKYIDFFSKPPQPVKKGSGGASGASGKGK